MPGIKTNERPGTRAVLRHYSMSASKARQVLDLIRGQDVTRATETLQGVERDAGEVIGKLLASAVANAVHNDHLDAEDLYVSACFADEGGTLKRWRPRARGRASRIRKRTCHITVIVATMPEDRLMRHRTQRIAQGAQRSRRVSESRRRADLAGRLGRRRTARELADAAAATEAATEAESDAAVESGSEAAEAIDATSELYEGPVEDSGEEVGEEEVGEVEGGEVLNDPGRDPEEEKGE
ncbi:MAG: 50S ribosomal protein L22 [Acidimicrobiales bacterium]